MKFQLGQLVATPGVLEATTEEWRTVCVARHATGDWGDLEEEDRAANEAGLANGERLMSVYPLAEGSAEKLWIITEADRSATTLLLPSEY